MIQTIKLYLKTLFKSIAGTTHKELDYLAEHTETLHEVLDELVGDYHAALDEIEKLKGKKNNC